MSTLLFSCAFLVHGGYHFGKNDPPGRVAVEHLTKSGFAMGDWNENIISEFRDNEGKVGGMFEGRPLLLLHHKGARSGTDRVAPLQYQAADGGYAVFASKAGADTNPHWLHNLKANPMTKIEVGTEVVSVKARVAEGAEHDEIWTTQKERYTNFAEYEKKTARDRIPVVVLDVV